MNLRRVSGLSSYAAVLVATAVLVGLGVYIGRELVRPERRAWEGTNRTSFLIASGCIATVEFPVMHDSSMFVMIQNRVSVL